MKYLKMNQNKRLSKSFLVILCGIGLCSMIWWQDSRAQLLENTYGLDAYTTLDIDEYLYQTNLQNQDPLITLLADVRMGIDIGHG